MIIPMVCFSCGKPIAHLWFTSSGHAGYLDLVKKYVNAGNKNPEFLALCDLAIGRECCRRMFLSQHDMYDKIK